MEPITLASSDSGPEIFAAVAEVLKDYSARTGLTATMRDFCNAAGISRQQMYLYNRGQRPASEGLGKIAAGLRAWGYTVNVII